MTSPEDQELEERIRLALQVDTSLSASIERIQIEANNGEVTLQGEVPSEQEKEGISTTVEQMPGVKKVENQLQVASR
jgi:osmotically-inducible protein OsmY